MLPTPSRRVVEMMIAAIVPFNQRAHEGVSCVSWPATLRALIDNTECSSNLLFPAEVKSTDARQHFQFETWVAPTDASECFVLARGAHIARRNHEVTDMFQ